MRPRILAAIVGVALLAVAALAIPLAIRLGNDARAESIARLERVATTAASRLPSRLAPGRVTGLPDLASDGQLAVYDPAGRRRGGEGPARADEFARRSLTGHADEGSAHSSLVVGLPVVRGRRVIAAVRASEPIEVTRTQVRRQRLTIALFGFAAVVIAALVGLAVSAALTRPLRRLRATAVRLGHGDFSVRSTRSGISEVDDVGQALDETAARLGDLVQRERTFSAHASHQLRTPLAALRLAVEAELARPRSDPAATLHEVLVETDRLEQTISDLLMLARGQAERGPVELDAVAYETAARWRSAFSSVGRSIRVAAVPDVCPEGQASITALAQILDVLVANALQHGAGTVTISVGADATGHGVITITDEGIGITEDPEVLFDAGNDGRHGFGLPLAAALADADGARLRLAKAGPHPEFEITLA